MDYRAAGVDLDAADAHVDRIAPLVTATWGEGVVGGFGGFAAGVRIPPGYTSPVLMMCTDGVGTKLELARRAGRWDGVGQDLVAMSVDDLVVAGATSPRLRRLHGRRIPPARPGRRHRRLGGAGVHRGRLCPGRRGDGRASPG
jgi:hypothetical protein